MVTNRYAKKTLSLIIALVMVLGSFSSVLYAQEPRGQVTTSREALAETAAMKIKPEVREELEANDFAEILVYMKEQVDVEEIAYSTQYSLASHMTPYNVKMQVRENIVEQLRSNAEDTQYNILKYLEKEKEKGNVLELKSFNIVNMVYVKASREVVEKISYLPEVKEIYSNKVHSLQMPEINPEIVTEAIDGLEWNIERVKANQVWNLGFDGTGAVVGMIDSGATWDHPALREQWRGYDIRTETADPEGHWFDPVYGAAWPADNQASPHGTHVLGTIVGQEANGKNKIGVAPGAKWIAVRAFDNQGSTTGEWMLSAAEWMLAPGGDPSAAPDVINNSWGGGAGIDDWYRDAIKAWRAAGILPVFAAGNQLPGEPAPGPGSISVPSNYPEAFAVGATDINNIRGSFSKLGPSPYDPEMIKPNISAPGVNIRSSVPGGYAGGWNGTSMATPAVTGVAALLLSANSGLTLEDLEYAMESSATPLTDGTHPEAPNFAYGYGLVDAFEAVSSIAVGSGYITGKVLTEGNDREEPTIVHDRVKEAYIGGQVDIVAEVKDDISITDLELLVKQDGKSYWLTLPMELISGDHRDGLYKGVITSDLLVGDKLIYKIVAKDFGGTFVSTEDYQVKIRKGMIPGDYIMDFESYPVGWTLKGSWQWGIPSGVSPKAFSGEKLVGTVLNDDYPIGSNDWMIMPPIDLSDASLETASLRFHQWYDLAEGNDMAYVAMSTDKKNWTRLGTTYRGSNTKWEEVYVGLEKYIGNPNPIYIGFHLYSDNSNTKAGWYIDDVRLMAKDDQAPNPPRNLSAKAEMGSIELNWDRSSAVDLSHYNLYRKLQTEEEFTKIGTSKSTSFNDLTALAESTYNYYITAEDFSKNESKASEVATVTSLNYDTLYSTSFEEDNGGFTTGRINNGANPWQWGKPSSGPMGAKTGEKLWATNLSGNYPGNSSAYIQTPDIDLPANSNIMLLFSQYIDMESGGYWDYGQVQISKDNGENWINITPTESGKYGLQPKVWEDERIALNSYGGERVQIRFYFSSDGIVNNPGWYIDDVAVIVSDDLESQSLRELAVEKEALIEGSGSIERQVEDRKEEKEDVIRYELPKEVKREYKKIDEDLVANIPLATGRIPVENGIITVLETGKSVRVNSATGKFTMKHPANEANESYTLRAEAYGYYPEEVRISVPVDGTVNHEFNLRPVPKGSIEGQVIDRYFNTPAANAVIRVVEDSRIATAYADENGYFLIPEIYEGDYTLRVMAEGFEANEFRVEVVGNQTSEVTLGLKKFVGFEGEIIYDNESRDSAVVGNDPGHGVATRFTPKQYGKLKGVNIYMNSNEWPKPGGDKIAFAVYSINPNGNIITIGKPITRSINRGEWNYIDLTDFALGTEDDFMISTVQVDIGERSPGVAIDLTVEDESRYYFNNNGNFTSLKDEGIDGGLMMRAVMEYGVAVPKISNLEEVNYTNKDTIKIEGRSASDSKVNIYNNGESVYTGNAVDGKFEAVIDLVEGDNIITVDGEHEGNKTEPSKPINVIRDQVAPELEVEKPLDNISINYEGLHVIGKAVDNVLLDKLTINGKDVPVDEEGNFHGKIILDQGKNVITIKAYDKAGNISEIQRTVYLDLEKPSISDIKPSEDLYVRAGERVKISFRSQAAGNGYFKILLPFESFAVDYGIEMEEKEEGLYEGSWLVPEELEAVELQILLTYLNDAGYEVTEIAEGRIRIVNDMRNLPANTIILGDQAYDARYLDRNPQAKQKLADWVEAGKEVYVKLNKDTLVDSEGHVVDMRVLEDFISYFNGETDPKYYKK